MIRHLRASIHLLVFATILFGVVYPFAVWVVAHFFFPAAAEGYVVTVNGQAVGLHNVGQTFTAKGYFWSRPSAIPQGAGPLLVSRASNLSWSSPVLRSTVEAACGHLGGSCQICRLLFLWIWSWHSASGMNPEISLKAALFQIPRVAAARGVSEDELRALVLHLEGGSLFGVFPHRVNVLKLNCELDHHYPIK